MYNLIVRPPCPRPALIVPAAARLIHPQLHLHLHPHLHPCTCTYTSTYCLLPPPLLSSHCSRCWALRSSLSCGKHCTAAMHRKTTKVAQLRRSPFRFLALCDCDCGCGGCGCGCVGGSGSPTEAASSSRARGGGRACSATLPCARVHVTSSWKIL
ncbi:hypothetical protein B484DRAFT_119087, partial [Ochromonadaceae sp. CCMP2298]